ncbi:MAG: bifunctional (p)ppGpp synthetase/guanosine-3',5'-bis(diphosphate) 3'-pyrophosphohydrolase [Gammaproteobacteria bacterium]|nr:bifunctional (p)ppGpp synthetase/guanosine-3',5'-bis(diphosphate) 3'-pyrophosphohydrolase [Gammaproteobacteria bacterium]
MKTTTAAPAASVALLDELVTTLAHHDDRSPAWQDALALGRETAAIVAALEAEREIVAGTLLQPLLAAGLLPDATAAATFGDGPVRLARQLGQLGDFQSGARWSPDRPLSAAQADALRRMLLAIVTDPRLVLARLAAQLRRIRHARELDEPQRLRLAWETREIYAPLANRLGIGQLKWELEDLAFRYLEPAAYRRIATQLNERRADRERYIDEAIAEVRAELARAGVAAEVIGRPKHIFSIWRKMQRKNLAFAQVFDIRALRIVTGSVADCYAALGAVHGRWPYVPGEFDDYIATPKDNLYRSLHTAVIGPGGQPLEVQIRTREMHEQAELGVAAHWRYKEGRGRDAAWEQKIQWLRELLAPRAEGESDGDFLGRVRADLFGDRVYALTPRGEVVDLPAGSTPLDFAYQVHTELGHRCRGARVNAHIVPLDHRLQNGEVVEIIAGRIAQPSRDWLLVQQGFLASPRSRAKVRAWFRRRDAGQNRQEGRELFEHELARAGAGHSLPLPELLQELGQEHADALYLALGAGDLTSAQLAGAIQRCLRNKATAQPAPAAAPQQRPAPAVQVAGVGGLLSTYARCCSPAPPEPITGYVTVGRGVTAHRADCSNLARLAARAPQRLLQVEWGQVGQARFPVEVVIHAMERPGLARDVTTLLAESRLPLERLATRPHTRHGSVDLALRIAVGNLDELTRLLPRLAALPGVISARRRA